MPIIKGIIADERWKLKPDILVNAYELKLYSCEWIESYRVRELDNTWLEYLNECNGYSLEWEDIGLEPCDECGNPVKLKDAYIEECIPLF